MAEGNVAEAEGGAIYSNLSTVVVDAYAMLNSNRAEKGCGGAVSLVGGFGHSFTSLSVEHNEARDCGGGLNLEQASFTAFNNVRLVGNSVSGGIGEARGSAVCSHGSRFVLDETTLSQSRRNIPESRSIWVDSSSYPQPTAVCPLGKRFANWSTTSTCLPCPAGKTTNGAGQSICIGCDAGFALDEATKSCRKCGAGMYAIAGSVQCSESLFFFPVCLCLSQFVQALIHRINSSP